jgi:hypothetical protein
MLATARAVFVQYHPPWVVAPIFLARIISFLAIIASKRDDWANILLF